MLKSSSIKDNYKKKHAEAIATLRSFIIHLQNKDFPLTDPANDQAYVHRDLIEEFDIRIGEEQITLQLADFPISSCYKLVVNANTRFRSRAEVRFFVSMNGALRPLCDLLIVDEEVSIYEGDTEVGGFGSFKSFGFLDWLVTKLFERIGASSSFQDGLDFEFDQDAPLAIK